MVSLLIPNVISYPLTKTIPATRIRFRCKSILCFEPQNPKFLSPPSFTNKVLKPNNEKEKPYINSFVVAPSSSKMGNGGGGKMGKKKMVMLVLCGFGYWVQGFRCFPWLALNFHMAHNLNFHPSTLQLVQNSGNLPMVAKPLYGIFSDALYIGGAHRIPYVSIGVLVQVLSWAPLALLPFVGEALPTLMSCVLLSNLGAAITEVAQDALVAEYGQKHKMVGLQSYTFMAIAVAGILGNSLGGIILSKAHPRVVLLTFTALLLIHLSIALTTKEEFLALSKPSSHLVGHDSILSSFKRQFSNLLLALSGDTISRPLTWVVASITMVPMLTGSMFCYQTQFLNLDPSIIGMSKVIGQMVLLSLTVVYDRFWKYIPMRKFVTSVQILYASSLVLDLVLAKQINLKFGIPNDVYALCFSGLAEIIATFKTIPFFVLIGSLCPPGCEASVTAFLASALTLSSILSGFLGIGLAYLLGITSGDYSSLPVGIAVQCFTALVPLIWLNNLPISLPMVEKERMKGRSKRRRKSRRVGRVVLNAVFSYRRKRESETQR